MDLILFNSRSTKIGMAALVMGLEQKKKEMAIESSKRKLKNISAFHGDDARRLKREDSTSTVPYGEI